MGRYQVFVSIWDPENRGFDLKGANMKKMKKIKKFLWVLGNDCPKVFFYLKEAQQM